jgi:HD-GYP domain-containing protein (c-di-GMP phosphodiesterase class II)
VYDALRTRRPYRDAWESAKILAYIEERAGTQFEPEAALVFVEMLKKIESGIQISAMPTVSDAP